MLTLCVIIQTTQIDTIKEKNKTFLSVKLIFEENWEDYLKTHSPREIEIKEVEKMLSCKDESRGCFVCYCKKCNEYHFERFGCNSRLCSNCGKRHTDQWANRLANKIAKNIVHRHLVFTLPKELRLIIKEDRELQKVISDSAYRTIRKVFSKIKRKDIMPGVIGVVHPFGKGLIFNPHTHCIATEGGFTRDGKFISIGNYIPYDLLHKEWQYEVLTSLKKYISKGLIDFLFDKYPNGFAAYVKPERIKSSKQLAQYIGRYVRHPAIANSRIDKYDGRVVGFFMKIMKIKYIEEKYLFMVLCILSYSIFQKRISD